MSLVGADFRAVAAEGEALLVVGADDFADQFFREADVRGAGLVD